jgi:RNA recognition motif-containing protein
MSTCILFVGNISEQADASFLKRLFSAYGAVKNASVEENQGYKFGRVEYSHIDDADSAIASLHLRYCMAPGVPIIVLYDKSSPVVSDYGRRVGENYRSAVQNQTEAFPLPLDSFDHHTQRATVDPPLIDLRPAPFTRPAREGSWTGAQ